MTRPHLSNALFLDIETATQYPSFQEADQRTRSLWEEKCIHYFQRDDFHQAYTEKAALFAEFSRVTTIAMAYFTPEGNLRAKAFCQPDERSLLKRLAYTLQTYPITITHNGLEFDLPFLARRFLANAMAVPKQIDTRNMKPWEVAHKDTMAMWKFTSLKTYISLDALCHALSIPTPKQIDSQPIHGSQASAIFHQGDTDTLTRYCLQDTIATVRAYLALSQDKPLSETSIIYP